MGVDISFDFNLPLAIIASVKLDGWFKFQAGVSIGYGPPFAQTITNILTFR
jgi:hypothetical protein